MKKYGFFLMMIATVAFLISSTSMSESENVPVHIKTLLTNSCFYCHSSQTNYLCYQRISPVSWFINNLIVEWKEHLV